MGAWANTDIQPHATQHNPEYRFHWKNWCDVHSGCIPRSAHHILPQPHSLLRLQPTNLFFGKRLRRTFLTGRMGFHKKNLNRWKARMNGNDNRPSDPTRADYTSRYSTRHEYDTGRPNSQDQTYSSDSTSPIQPNATETNNLSYEWVGSGRVGSGRVGSLGYCFRSFGSFKFLGTKFYWGKSVWLVSFKKVSGNPVKREPNLSARNVDVDHTYGNATSRLYL